MMRMPRGVMVVVCGALMCLPALTAASQQAARPPLTLSVLSDCRVNVPDFINNWDLHFRVAPRPWPDGVTPTQYPPPGLLRPASLTEAAWPSEIPEPFPNWPEDVLPVYVFWQGDAGFVRAAATEDIMYPTFLSYGANCRATVPDFIEDWNDVFPCVPPPWPEDADLSQYPPPGPFGPADLDPDDWPEELPVPFPTLPWQDLPVFVWTVDEDDIVTAWEVANMGDITPPGVLPGAPNLFQRIVIPPTASTFTMPDFRPRLRPFIFDNCTPAELLEMDQNPPQGTYSLPGTLPAGRLVIVTIRDIMGSERDVIAQIWLVAENDTRPVITPNGVNDTDRRFHGSVCDDPWHCGPISQFSDRWECGVPYDDPGATAYDPVTGQNLTPYIQRRIVGVVDTSRADVSFVVRYWIGDEDDLNNNGLTERIVTVRDRNAPVITLGAIGGGPSGAHPLWRDWNASAAPGFTEPQWVQDLRNTPNYSFPWAVWPFYPNYLPSPFNFVNEPWNDETAMPWRCWGIDPYEEFIDVYDDCEGVFDERKLNDNVLVTIVKVRMASALYADGEETFYAGGSLGELREAGLTLQRGRPPTPNPWYGYRIYYFARDDQGNLGYLSRHVNPLSGEWISLAEPTTITISCDGNGLQQLYDVERLDRGASVCRGDVTHLIRGTGGIDMTPDGYYVPGTYYRYYTIEGGQTWPEPWRRTIIVENTDPAVLLYNQQGETVFGLNSAIVLPWCTFLDYPGDTPEAQADAWADSWWAAQPGYDPGDESAFGTFGYSAAHPCDDDIALTSWVDVRGLGVLKNTMLSYYRSYQLYSPPDHLLGAYTLTHELQDPRHSLVRATRPVFLLHDIDLDLIFSPVIEVEHEDDHVTIARVECGTPFTVPEVGRIWDRCSGRALDYDIVVTVYDAAGNLIPFEAVNIFEPGVVRLVYNALIGAQQVPAPVRTIELHIEDTLPPEIVLLGGEFVDLGCGDDFIEPFALAFDQCDGDLTQDILVGGDLGPYLMPGVYYRTYTVRDRAGNEAQALRAINVIIYDEPEMTLLGAATMTVECGAVFSDPGAEAYVAECDLDVTGEIIVSGSVDTSTPGTYVLEYRLPGVWEAPIEPLRRTVTVVDTSPPEIDLGTLPDGLVYDADGFIRFECLDPWLYDPDNVSSLVEPDDLTADDDCAGNLGGIQPMLGPNDAGVTVWAWRLGPDGEPLWIFEIGDIRPDRILYNDLNTLPDLAGDYLLLYESHDGNGNWLPARDENGWPDIFDAQGRLDIFDANGELKVDYIRLLRIADDEPPVLVLDNSDPLTFECGDAFVGPGYTAMDNCDGDITDQVQFTPPDMQTPGVYEVVYTVMDRAGNVSNSETVEVTVEDTLPPVITLFWADAPVADSQRLIECGSEIPLAWTALDKCDGDISELVNLVITEQMGGKDTPTDFTLGEIRFRPGVYHVTLNVSDRQGLAAVERSMVIEVEDTRPPALELALPPQDAVDELGRFHLACVQAWDESLHEPGYMALDQCDGDLTGRVFRLVWAIDADDAKRVVWDDENDVPMLYAVEEIIGAPGAYLFVYLVRDGAGFWTPAADAAPAQGDEQSDLAYANQVAAHYLDAPLFDDDDRLDIFDADGGLDPARTTLRWGVVSADTPTLTLEGETELVLECGRAYNEPGYRAVSDCFGNLTEQVSVGEVDTQTPGIYTLVYAVTDAVGNSVQTTREVTVADTLAPEIILEGEATIDLLLGQPWADPGVLSALDQCDGDLTDSVTVEGAVNPNESGDYTLLYRVEDSQGNVGEAMRLVRVGVQIRLSGETEMTLECGERYSEPGARVVAFDISAGDGMGGEVEYPDAVVEIDDVEDLEDLGYDVGVFEINYRAVAADDPGRVLATATRTVIVEDTLPPDLVLRGATEVAVDHGAVYQDAGVLSVYDQCDGPISLDLVWREGVVDTNRPGVQTITYTVKDSTGNKAVAVRTVTVGDPEGEPEGEPPPAEGEPEGEPPPVEGEGEPPECCGGCRGCDDDKDAAIEQLKRNLNDLLLIGLSMIVLVAFAFGGRRQQ